MKDKAPVSELLQWLSGAPRTLEWNAILAYDRDKTNVVLRQEYIERFDTDSYLKPYTELIVSTDNTAEYTYDYVFDAPRLSFTNATIVSSKAMLSQKVVGGSQLSLSKPDGLLMTRVEKVFSLDAMDGPWLESEINLLESKGHVDLLGKVTFDISSGRNPRLFFASTESERKKGGEHFKALFNALPDPNKTIVLNELTIGPNDVLKPADFRIRTHAAPNSQTRGTLEYGSGAVLVFITMQNEANGYIPLLDSDLRFLIPDGHSATMLLGQDFLMRNIYVRGCRAIANGGGVFDFKLIYAGMFLRELRVTEGKTHIGKRVGSSDIYSLLMLDDVILPLADEEACTFSVFIDKGNLVVALRGTADQAATVTLFREQITYHATVTLFWDVRNVYKVVADPVTGAVTLVLLPDQSFEQLRMKPGEFGRNPRLDWRLNGIVAFGERELSLGIAEKLALFVQSVGSIDVFRLNNLLFRGENTVVISDAHLPGDMALFAHISPRLTQFVVDPLEPLIGHGMTQQFSVSPVQTGVQWSVKALPGGTGAIGTINASGLYTAPKESEIEGVYVRVRVTATKGAFTSSALVTVVVRDISVNPLIQICGPRASRALSAGTIGNGVLTWKIADPASDASIIPSLDPDGDHTFVAGAADTSNKYRIDEVVVTNSLTGNKQSAWVLTLTGIAMLELLYKATDRPDQVQCEAYFSGFDTPVEGIGLEWKIILGEGSIDAASGLLTLDLTSKYRFLVITCALEGIPGYDGFCILPLPLIPLPELLNVLGTANVLLAKPDQE